MIPVLIALWWQALGLPHVGYLKDSGGRLWEVSGVSGNFVLGEPLDADVISAVEYRSFLVQKTHQKLLLRGLKSAEFDTLEGPAMFRWNAQSKVLTVWLPAEKRALFIDPASGASANSNDPLPSPCADPGWLVDEPIREVHAQSSEWLFLYTDTARYAARCTSRKVFLLPVPEAVQ